MELHIWERVNPNTRIRVRIDIWEKIEKGTTHLGFSQKINTYSNLKPFGWVERSDITTEKVTFIKQGMA